MSTDMVSYPFKDPENFDRISTFESSVAILCSLVMVFIGINFPCYSFENQADTEGFAQMANRAGFQVVGLPNYIVWHIDTEEKEGNLKGRKSSGKMITSTKEPSGADALR